MGREREGGREGSRERGRRGEDDQVFGFRRGAGGGRGGRGGGKRDHLVFEDTSSRSYVDANLARGMLVWGLVWENESERK